MRRLLRICVLLALPIFAKPVSVADTAADLRDVFIFMPPPAYPQEAWARRSDGLRRIEGVTLLRGTLDAKGAVTEIRIINSSGNQSLDSASVDALRRWRAKPGRAGRFFDIPFKFTRPGPSLPGKNDGLGLQGSRDR